MLANPNPRLVFKPTFDYREILLQSGQLIERDYYCSSSTTKDYNTHSHIAIQIQLKTVNMKQNMMHMFETWYQK